MTVESNAEIVHSLVQTSDNDTQSPSLDALVKRINELEAESKRRLDKLQEAGTIIATLQQRLRTEQDQVGAAARREAQAAAALEEINGKLVAVQAVSATRHDKLLEAERIIAAQRDRIAVLQRTIAELEARLNEAHDMAVGGDIESVERPDHVNPEAIADGLGTEDNSQNRGREKNTGERRDTETHLERRLLVVRERMLIMRVRMARKVAEAEAFRTRLSISEATVTELRNQYDLLKGDLTESRLLATKNAAEAVAAREQLSSLRHENDRAMMQSLEARLQAEKSWAESVQAREALRTLEEHLHAARSALESANTRHADEMEKSETELRILRDRLATTESALAQRRLEVEETSQELEQARIAVKELQSDYDEAMTRLASAAQAEDELKVISEQLASRSEEIIISQKLLRDAEEAMETISLEADARVAAARNAEMILGAKLKEVTNELASLKTSHRHVKEELQRRTSERDASQAEQAKLTDQQVKLGAAIDEKLRHVRRLASEELGRAVSALLDLPRRPFESAKGHLERKIALFRRCGVFDAEWYLSANPDIAQAGVEPLRHYVEFGAKEGREPNPILAKEIQRVIP